MYLHLACILSFLTTLCASVGIPPVPASLLTFPDIDGRHTDQGSSPVEDRNERELWPENSHQTKTLGIQVSHHDYQNVIENSLGLQLSHEDIKEASEENDHEVDRKAPLEEVTNKHEKGNGRIEKQDHHLEFKDKKIKPESTTLSTFTTRPEPIPSPSPFTLSPLAKPTPNPKEHPTNRVEDLDENSALTDLLKDWSKSPNTPSNINKHKKPPGKNSPYLHTLYPAKELSYPQKLYFSTTDEGERKYWAYEVKKGDTLKGVSMKLGVTMAQVVDAEPLFVDGEYE